MPKKHIPIISCPFCRERHSLDAALSEGQVRDLIHELLELRGNALGVWCYTTAFRTRPTKDLTTEKRLDLVREVKALFDSKKFKFGGKVYAVTEDQVRQGLRIVIDAEKIGLKNHNYLKQVLIRLVEKVEAREEEREEDRKRQATRRGPGAMSGAKAPPHPGRNPENRRAASTAFAKVGEIAGGVVGAAKTASDEATQAEADVVESSEA